ncbi:rasGEF domain-containing protein [Hirsutella rhossiliensis]|uniref:RasGEF domain-containing protein n=1 Tax=Hirsutella rhossiliensis TaxID=111463 RepID=A0A9P8MTZ5_9HYPO|nr:rasGEF domain-containing protein [Hirsutella rhossiliensis]KAH0960389.1 rasGEF domain-containing protein [Hirsutella rhossiliensis]
MTESSVTLPLDEGDVVLVHSVHTNGWADGTLLATGARGWLPTNHCNAYEPDDMRSLLNALLNFWDLLQSTSMDDNEIFRNQEFMKGIIAGVRSLLERTNCLNRESPVVLRSDSLRRSRKSLLSELSLLVKTVKRLQKCQKGALEPPEDVNDLDEMILKAFKIVIKAVRFLDILDEDTKSRASAAVTVVATVAEESGSGAPASELGGTSAANAPASPWGKRLRSLTAPVHPAQNRLSRGSLQQANSLSSAMAHRVSLAGPSPLSRPDHLASERLNRSHDKFLSHLGSFIGRLNLQSHSRPELALAIKLSATSGGELLAVIDSVCAYNSSSLNALGHVRVAMFERIKTMVLSARDILGHSTTEDGSDLIMPNDNATLLMAATGCVRAAGECVAQAKAAVESVLDAVMQERTRTPSVTGRSDATSPAESCNAAEPPQPRRRTLGAVDKPLPRVPKRSLPTEQHHPPSRAPGSSRAASVHDNNVSSAASSISSARPAPGPRTAGSTAPYPADRMSGADALRSEQEMHSSRFDVLAASSAGSTATYLSRDSKASLVLQTSTRATTPDHGLGPRSQPSMSELSMTGSFSQAEEADDVETRLVERTYAHELMFNKEGQVTGGSLPALVERLTTHESTPDAAFVSTFYLTFRLFCTPVKLTQTLIERFEYVGESPHMSAPVRLRVYNAFKGWLESHWREQTDRAALKLIISFAEERLGAVLPTAGPRLLELAKRVSEHGLLVPRLVSSMGKTNTAIAQYVPADTPLPQPVISKSQLHTLNSFKAGGSTPTLLDFEPLELARQLIIRQMAIFCSILPEELLASQWMKNGGAEARNVKAMSSLSTDLSNLVAETILQHHEIKKRAAVIKQWIKIAHHCLELHNYDGLIAIVCSLNSSTISRLRKTWDSISFKHKEMLRAMQEIVEPSQNHKVLRTRLHDHMLLGTEPDDAGAGGLTVVNFDKHCRTAKIIGELQGFQISYRLMEVPDMQDWLGAQIRRVRDGDQGNGQVTYYRKSLLLEPRESAHRRENEPPMPISTGSGASCAGLFAWMSCDRGGQTPTPA